MNRIKKRNDHKRYKFNILCTIGKYLLRNCTKDLNVRLLILHMGKNIDSPLDNSSIKPLVYDVRQLTPSPAKALPFRK